MEDDEKFKCVKARVEEFGLEGASFSIFMDAGLAAARELMRGKLVAEGRQDVWDEFIEKVKSFVLNSQMIFLLVWRTSRRQIFKACLGLCSCSPIASLQPQANL